MKKIITIFFFLAHLFLINCASLNKKSVENADNLIIRYVNLKVIYNYIINRDVEAKNILKSKKIIIQELRELEDKLLISKENIKELLHLVKTKRDDIKKIEDEIISKKTEIYRKINMAVKKTARKLGIDYILNISNEVIYAKKKFDVTEDVLRELLRFDKRISPVSR